MTTDPNILIDHLDSRAEQVRSLMTLIQTARVAQVPTPTLAMQIAEAEAEATPAAE